MNYDITYKDTDGSKFTITIYAAYSLKAAVEQFERELKDCKVVKVEETILQ